MADSIGLVSIKSNADLDAEAVARVRAENPPEQPKHIDELAAYVRKCFADAEQFRSRTIRERLDECLRRRNGKYSSAELAQIKARGEGACSLFFNITGMKAGAGESWLNDVTCPPREQIFAVVPTPVPDLPGDMKQGVHQATVDQFRKAQALGDQITVGDVREFALSLYDQELKAAKDEAEKSAARLTEKIADQLVEGGWKVALSGFNQDVTTYPFAVLKGPVVRVTKRQKWGADGTPEVVTEEIPTFENPAPHDIYFAPNARSPQEGPVCESVRMDRGELAGMKGHEGWNDAQIDAALAEGAAASSPAPDGDSARAAVEERDTTINDGVAESSLRGIVFWGAVEGKLLAEWGLTAEDPTKFYDITALLFGSHVVRAILNPDPLGAVPYYVTSWKKVNRSVYGRSIPEDIADCQDAVNGCLRALINNLGLSSGPMGAVDIDAIDPACDYTKLYPGKMIPYHGLKVNGGHKPVDFFQPDSNAGVLQGVADFFIRQSDDRAGIPRYVYGNQDMTGALATASGLSMLRSDASMGIKTVVSHIDQDIVRPALEALARWNMQYLVDDPEWAALKGDIRIVPRGVMAALVREETQKRRMDFLDRTNNPTDLEIMGIAGRAAVLRGIAPELDLPVDDIVPTQEEMLARMRQAEQAQMEAPQPGMPGQPAGMPTQPGALPAPMGQEMPNGGSPTPPPQVAA